MVLEKIFFNWPITNKNCSHISCMIDNKYGNFVQDPPYIIPKKEQFIVPPNFREDFFNFSQ